MSTLPGLADYAARVLALNPLAYWRLNETVPSPALNKVTNSGSLGSAGDGYAVLDATKGQPGIVGNSLRVLNISNDLSYCGSKVDVPYNVALNPNPPWSVEFWAKPNSLGTDSSGFCPLSSLNANGYGGANRSGWIFYVNSNGVWQFRLGTFNGYAGIVLATNGNAATGVWQHIVSTYDGVTGRLYANGTLVGAAAAPQASWTRNTQMAFRMGGTPLPQTGSLGDGPAKICLSGNAGNRGYDGWLDEVAIYPTVLSSSQIAAHYAAATTNNAGYGTQILADGPVGYWNLDEPAATTPTSFPIAANAGSLGTSADGTNMWGALAAQPGPGYGGLGASNQACFFDGESGYVGLKDAPGLHISGNITLMAWIRPSVKDFFRDIIAHGWDSNYAETFLRISRSDDGTKGGTTTNFYEVGVTDGTNYYDSALFPIPDGDLGNWVFLAGIYDGASWNLYRNGALVSSFASDHGALDISNRWSIGSRRNPSETASKNFAAQGLFFGGGIDEPAIFGRALSASDISNLYNAALVPPVITRAVQNPGTLFKGASASFSVWAEGNPALGYLWYSNGVFTGVTTTNLLLTNLGVAPSNTIAVIVTNAYGAATSSVSFAVVASPPAFTQQPLPVSRFSGRPFTFLVGVSGSLPMSLQWNANGVPIAGANSSSYTGIASPTNAFNYSCTASNEAGISNSAPAALTVLPLPTGYPGGVLAGGPVAYWRLGESSGAVAHDFYGGHDGTYFGAALGRAGYCGSDPDTAVAFSGTNSYVGNINGTNGPGIDFSGHTNFSIEVWVNGATGMRDQSTIIAKGLGDNGNGSTGGTEQFALDVTNGVYRFYTRGVSNIVYDADATNGPNGTWQHIVGVCDDLNAIGGGANLYLYVNGQLQGQHATPSSGLRVSSDPVSIGSKRTGNDPNYDGTFNGTIDEVAIYPYALTAAQIQVHYTGSPAMSISAACPTTNAVPGGVLGFIGQVCNTGNVDLTNVVILASQTLSSGTNLVVIYPLLSSGQCRAFSGSIPVPTDTCSITDILTATSTTVCPSSSQTTVVAQTTNTCPILTSPSLAISVFCPDTNGTPGGVIGFTGFVTNTGNVTLTNLMVTNCVLSGTASAGSCSLVTVIPTLDPNQVVQFNGTEGPINNDATAVSNAVIATAQGFCGSLVSAIAAGACPVCELPTITGGSTNVFLTADGLLLSVSVDANGTHPFSVNWQIGSTNIPTGDNTTLNLLIPFDQVPDFLTFSNFSAIAVHIGNNCGGANGSGGFSSPCVVCLSRGVPVTSATVVGASQTGPPLTNSCGNVGLVAKWYVMAAASSGEADVNVLQATTTNCFVSVFAGPITNLTRVTCDQTITNFQTRLQFPATAGQSYWLVVTNAGTLTSMTYGFVPLIASYGTLSNGQFQLSSGVAPPLTYSFLAASALSGQPSWSNLFTTTFSTNGVTFVDPSSTNFTQRFYRIAPAP